MRTLTIAALALAALLATANLATAGGHHKEQKACGCNCEPHHGAKARCQQWQQAAGQNCHCDYYNPEWGAPVALVVPPTAEKYREMGWGVGNTRMRRIYPQFSRQYPGEFTGGSEGFRPMPPIPSDTTQAGYYYVRGPW